MKKLNFELIRKIDYILVFIAAMLTKKKKLSNN